MFITSLLLLTFVLGYAQEKTETSMMSGIVLDEKGKLVPGAIVKISKKKQAYDITVGEDGMYYSGLLPVGYYHVDIRANNRYYQAQKVHLVPSTGSTKYYNFKLRAGVAELYSDSHDPQLRVNAGEQVPQKK